MRYFEFRDEKSDKFWEIDLQGNSTIVRYGKRGASGQTKRKDFESAAEAQKAFDKLIAEKTREGYQEKSAGAAAQSTPSAGNPASDPSSAVLNQIKRLGANLKPPGAYPSETEFWPASIRRIVFDIEWPKSATYGNDAENSDPWWVWRADFSGFQPWNSVDFNEYTGCEQRPFTLLGIADGGNYLLSLALDSKDSQDPDLYVIDHDAFEEEVLEPISLSRFLATLKREEKEDD